MTPGDRRSSWVAARRQVARQHHPDVGGDASAFVRELARVDQELGGRQHVPSVAAVQRRSRLARYAARRRLRWLRSALPRRFPGSRRYIEL